MSYSVIELNNEGLVYIKKCLENILGYIDFPEVQNILDQVLSGKESFYVLYENLVEGTSLIQTKKPKTGVSGSERDMYSLSKKVLGKGTYGQVALSKLNNVEYITKAPIVKGFDENQRERIISNFLEESITHAILYCFHDKMVESIRKDFRQPLVPIYKIFKFDSNVRPKLSTVIEKLDMDFENYVTVMSTNKIHEKNFPKLIVQLCSNIYYLQKSVNFMHRDLHKKNVMLKLKPSASDEEIDFENFTVLLENQEYNTYLIDFGMTCANLGKCYECNYKGIENTGIINVTNSMYENNLCVFNPSHDLRIFLGSLYYSYQIDLIDTKYSDYLKSIFDPYTKRVKEYVDDFFNTEKKEPSYWWYFYQCKNIDENFFPENIAKFFSQN